MERDSPSDVRSALITGASGFVGRNLCQSLSGAGWRVRGALRRAGTVPGAETLVTGELDGATDWQAALQNVEAVVHCAARVHVLEETSADPLAAFRLVNVAGSENLARQAVAAGVKHFVFLSSIGARIAESGRDATPYQISKLEAERALTGAVAGSGMALTLLRPPLIYGPGAPGNFALLLKVIERGLPLPLASVRNSRAFLYVGNLCDAVHRCLESPSADPRVYEIADGPGVSTPDLIRELARLRGRTARLLPCPLWLLRVAGSLTGRGAAIERLTGSLEIDASAVRHDLNWSPRWDLSAGLAASFSAQGETSQGETSQRETGA